MSPHPLCFTSQQGQFLNLLASAWLLSDNMDLVAREEKRVLELDLMSAALHE